MIKCRITITNEWYRTSQSSPYYFNDFLEALKAAGFKIEQGYEPYYIYLESFSDIEQIIKIAQQEVIISSFKDDTGCEYWIEIYNDYRE